MDRLDESGFVRGGEAVMLVLEIVFWMGVGEQLCVGVGLFVRGESKFLSSFKDKTFRCLLSEEAFIPDEVRKSG